MTYYAAMTGMNPTRRRAIDELRCIVLNALGEHDAAVYLFGSMATGPVRHASDIDVGILPRDDLPPAFFALLADDIEESTIPYDVDLVDLGSVDQGFRDRVIRTGVQWRG